MVSERKDLMLDMKYEVIKTAEREKKLCAKLAQMFCCKKTQISTVLKNKENIKVLYEAIASGERCHTSKIIRESKFSEMNKALYQWYLLAMSKNISLMGLSSLKRGKK